MVTLNVQMVKSAGYVYIKADGSIDPPSANITSLDNVTYTLTGNVNDQIWVQRNNIVLDGSGYVVDGTGTSNPSTGISLQTLSNVTIRNANVTGFQQGISIYYSNNCTLSKNNVYNGSEYSTGIYIVYSSGNIVSGNNVSGYWENFLVSGETGSHFDNVVDTSNLANGKPVWYVRGVSNVVYDYTTNASTIYVIDSTNVTIRDLSLSNNYAGVFLWNTPNSRIENVSATQNGAGISVQYAPNCTISSCNVSSSFGYYGIHTKNSGNCTISHNNVGQAAGEGIYVDSYCDNSTITWNNVSHCSGKLIEIWYSANCRVLNNVADTSLSQHGIYVGAYASSCNISGNTVSNNRYGIGVTDYCTNIRIYANNITNSWDKGIAIGDSSSIFVFHNNFVSNAINVATIRSSIIWDNGYPSGGNYWSSYAGVDANSGSYQNETGSDGIGDVPYVIAGSNQDNYPLMRLYVPFENQSIYIRADGSVDPSGAPVLRQGDKYTLTGNIKSNSHGIVVERDSIVLDGNGYTVQGAGSGYGISFSGRSNVTIRNTRIKAFDYGVFLTSSSYNTIYGNNITAIIGAGIYFWSSSNYNSVIENNITGNNFYGILFGYSSGNVVSGNNMANNYYGIRLSPSSNSFVRGNNITANSYAGIRLDTSSNYNNVSENNITNNARGIYLSLSSNNRFHHNNFIGNTQQVCFFESGYANAWDDGYPSGGNYWSSYTGIDNYSGQYQNETGSDGLGDTPLQINQNNKDNYPIMNQGLWTHDVAILNITLSTNAAYAGQVIEINVTAQNLGNRYESFNVTAFYDSAAIGNHEIHLLAPSTQRTLSFSWNTTDVAGGYYTISANANTIPEEVNTTNNFIIDGIAKITSPVNIISVVPCNQTGYSKDTFQQGTLAFFKVTINSTATTLQNTLITVNLYDNSSIAIGVVSIQAQITPDISTIIFGLPIPATATIGTATVYACAYTDWPSQGGFPHCPEMSATLEITGP